MEKSAAYVEELSEKAVSLLDSLSVKNEDVKRELTQLVKKLIDRDK